MPEAVVASDGRVAFTGLTTRWAEDNRLDIAGDLERLGPEGSGAIAEALREAGPTVTIERLDVPLIVHAWLGRQWCVWALAESAARVTPAGQIGAVIARIIGLGPGPPERSADGETLVFTDEELAVWCADQDADRWRIRVGANGEGGQSSTFEAVCHPWRGWYVGFERKGADGSTFSLSPTGARGLWRLLFAQLASALPISL